MGLTRRWRCLFSLIITWLSAIALAQVNTMPYFPFHLQDQRVLGGDKSLGFDTIVGQQVIGLQTAWKQVATDEDGKVVLTQYWTQSDQGSRWVAFEVPEQPRYTLVLQPAIVVPATVTTGQRIPLSGQILVSGIPVGAYSGTLRIITTNVAVDTPAGTFTGCLELDYDVTASVGSSKMQVHACQTQARNVGTVRAVHYPDESTSQQLLLLHASVGGVTWGHVPVDTGSYFPLRTGDRWILRETTAGGEGSELLQVETLSPTAFHGTTCYPLRSTYDAEATTRYWYRSEGNLLHTGTAKNGDETYLQPALVLLRAKVYLGQVMYTTGTLQTPGGTKPFEFYVRVTQMDMVAEVPAGAFGSCLVLDIQGTFGEMPNQERTRTEMWLAPGVGIVKEVIYEVQAAGVASAQWQPNWIREMLWGQVGGREHGRYPTVNTASYFPLRAGDRWTLLSKEADKKPRWRDIETCAPVATPEGQAFILEELRGGKAFAGYWAWASGKLRYNGKEEGGDQAFFDPPVTVLEETAYAGQTLRTQGQRRGPQGALPYEMTIHVVETHAEAETPAGSFPDCLVLQIHSLVESGREANESLTELWLAPSVGVVRMVEYQRTTTAAIGQEWAPGATSDLVWASVGGKTYGQPPVTLNTASYFPLGEGNAYLYRNTDGSVREVTVGAQQMLDGCTVWPFVVTDPGPETWTENWLGDDEGIKWSGLDGRGQQLLLQPPAVLVGPAARQWDLFHSSGEWLVNGVAAGTYEVEAQVLDTDATADVPARTFEHCLVVQVRGTYGPPGSKQSIESAYTLAPGVGVVRQTITAPTPGRTLVLLYAQVESVDYGVRPRPGRPGDLDGDGYVTAADARAMLECYLAGPSSYRVEADLAPHTCAYPNITPVPDGKVNDQDLKAFIGIWRALHSGGDSGG